VPARVRDADKFDPGMLTMDLRWPQACEWMTPIIATRNFRGLSWPAPSAVTFDEVHVSASTAETKSAKAK
jgi:hypothetical protein